MSFMIRKFSVSLTNQFRKLTYQGLVQNNGNVVEYNPLFNDNTSTVDKIQLFRSKSVPASRKSLGITNASSSLTSRDLPIARIQKRNISHVTHTRIIQRVRRYRRNYGFFDKFCKKQSPVATKCDLVEEKEGEEPGFNCHPAHVIIKQAKVNEVVKELSKNTSKKKKSSKSDGGTDKVNLVGENLETKSFEEIQKDCDEINNEATKSGDIECPAAPKYDWARSIGKNTPREELPLCDMQKFLELSNVVETPIPVDKKIKQHDSINAEEPDKISLCTMCNSTNFVEPPPVNLQINQPLDMVTKKLSCESGTENSAVNKACCESANSAKDSPKMSASTISENATDGRRALCTQLLADSGSANENINIKMDESKVDETKPQKFSFTDVVIQEKYALMKASPQNGILIPPADALNWQTKNLHSGSDDNNGNNDNGRRKSGEKYVPLLKSALQVKKNNPDYVCPITGAKVEDCGMGTGKALCDEPVPPTCKTEPFLGAKSSYNLQKPRKEKKLPVAPCPSSAVIGEKGSYGKIIQKNYREIFAKESNQSAYCPADAQMPKCQAKKGLDTIRAVAMVEECQAFKKRKPFVCTDYKPFVVEETTASSDAGKLSKEIPIPYAEATDDANEVILHKTHNDTVGSNAENRLEAKSNLVEPDDRKNTTNRSSIRDCDFTNPLDSECVTDSNIPAQLQKKAATNEISNMFKDSAVYKSVQLNQVPEKAAVRADNTTKSGSELAKIYVSEDNLDVLQAKLLELRKSVSKLPDTSSDLSQKLASFSFIFKAARMPTPSGDIYMNVVQPIIGKTQAADLMPKPPVKIQNSLDGNKPRTSSRKTVDLIKVIESDAADNLQRKSDRRDVNTNKKPDTIAEDGGASPGIGRSKTSRSASLQPGRSSNSQPPSRSNPANPDLHYDHAVCDITGLPITQDCGFERSCVIPTPEICPTDELNCPKGVNYWEQIEGGLREIVGPKTAHGIIPPPCKSKEVKGRRRSYVDIITHNFAMKQENIQREEEQRLEGENDNNTTLGKSDGKRKFSTLSAAQSKPAKHSVGRSHHAYRCSSLLQYLKNESFEYYDSWNMRCGFTTKSNKHGRFATSARSFGANLTQKASYTTKIYGGKNKGANEKDPENDQLDEHQQIQNSKVLVHPPRKLCELKVRPEVVTHRANIKANRKNEGESEYENLCDLSARKSKNVKKNQMSEDDTLQLALTKNKEVMERTQLNNAAILINPPTNSSEFKVRPEVLAKAKAMTIEDEKNYSGKSKVIKRKFSSYMVDTANRRDKYAEAAGGRTYVSDANKPENPPKKCIPKAKKEEEEPENPCIKPVPRKWTYKPFKGRASIDYETMVANNFKQNQENQKKKILEEKERIARCERKKEKYSTFAAVATLTDADLVTLISPSDVKFGVNNRKSGACLDAKISSAGGVKQVRNNDVRKNVDEFTPNNVEELQDRRSKNRFKGSTDVEYQDMVLNKMKQHQISNKTQSFQDVSKCVKSKYSTYINSCINKTDWGKKRFSTFQSNSTLVVPMALLQFLKYGDPPHLTIPDTKFEDSYLEYSPLVMVQDIEGDVPKDTTNNKPLANNSREFSTKSGEDWKTAAAERKKKRDGEFFTCPLSGSKVKRNCGIKTNSVSCGRVLVPTCPAEKVKGVKVREYKMERSDLPAKVPNLPISPCPADKAIGKKMDYGMMLHDVYNKVQSGIEVSTVDRIKPVLLPVASCRKAKLSEKETVPRINSMKMASHMKQLAKKLVVQKNTAQNDTILSEMVNKVDNIGQASEQAKSSHVLLTQTQEASKQDEATVLQQTAKLNLGDQEVRKKIIRSKPDLPKKFISIEKLNKKAQILEAKIKKVGAKEAKELALRDKELATTRLVYIAPKKVESPKQLNEKAKLISLEVNKVLKKESAETAAALEDAAEVARIEMEKWRRIDVEFQEKRKMNKAKVPGVSQIGVSNLEGPTDPPKIALSNVEEESLEKPIVTKPKNLPAILAQHKHVLIEKEMRTSIPEKVPEKVPQQIEAKVTRKDDQCVIDEEIKIIETETVQPNDIIGNNSKTSKIPPAKSYNTKSNSSRSKNPVNTNAKVHTQAQLTKELKPFTISPFSEARKYDSEVDDDSMPVCTNHGRETMTAWMDSNVAATTTDCVRNEDTHDDMMKRNLSEITNDINRPMMEMKGLPEGRARSQHAGFPWNIIENCKLMLDEKKGNDVKNKRDFYSISPAKVPVSDPISHLLAEQKDPTAIQATVNDPAKGSLIPLADPFTGSIMSDPAALSETVKICRPELDYDGVPKKKDDKGRDLPPCESTDPCADKSKQEVVDVEFLKDEFKMKNYEQISDPVVCGKPIDCTVTCCTNEPEPEPPNCCKVVPRYSYEKCPKPEHIEHGIKEPAGKEEDSDPVICKSVCGISCIQSECGADKKIVSIEDPRPLNTVDAGEAANRCANTFDDSIEAPVPPDHPPPTACEPPLPPVKVPPVHGPLKHTIWYPVAIKGAVRPECNPNLLERCKREKIGSVVKDGDNYNRAVNKQLMPRSQKYPTPRLDKELPTINSENVSFLEGVKGLLQNLREAVMPGKGSGPKKLSSRLEPTESAPELMDGKSCANLGSESSDDSNAKNPEKEWLLLANTSNKSENLVNADTNKKSTDDKI